MIAFRLLGPFEVRDASGALVALPRRKQRLLLAYLLLRAGTAVPVDEIVDVLWGDRPPNSARANLHSYISELRRILGNAPTDPGSRLMSVMNGYRLEVEPGEYDAEVFQNVTTDGRRALAEGRPGAAAECLARALGLWRGAALEGLEPNDRLLAHAGRLEQARLAAVEDQIDARLALGQHEALAVELAFTTARHPVRERLWGQFMVALHRTGRRAEALGAYNHLCEALEAELGVAPGPAVRQLHRQIRADDPAVRGRPVSPAGVAAPIWTAPALLPPGITDFTGRTDEVASLGQLIGRPPAGSTALVVVGIAGMAGVGKTTLAVHAAHRAAPSYPDGQLYANLHDAGAVPLPATDVLARFLRALGVDSRAMPADPAERAELYRSRLAGRRVLVLLDNAASEEQVRPLLPGAATCAVVVTSRRRLTGVEGARWLDLEVFGEVEAVEMLDNVVHDDRVTDEPVGAATLARLCGGLPLALRVVGARLTARPVWQLGHLVRMLGDERRRLDRLAIGDLEVRASLTLSLHGLDPTAQWLFRLLGLFDLPDFPAWFAAVVLGRSGDEVAEHLEALLDAQLLAGAGTDPAGQLRYRLHDLVRLYAREQAVLVDGAAECDRARVRGLAAWLAVAEVMSESMPGPCYAPIRGDTPRPPVDGLAELRRLAPLDWFDAERAALQSVLRQACREGRHELAFDLAARLENYYDMRGMYREWQDGNEAVLELCRRQGNVRGEATMLRGLLDVPSGVVPGDDSEALRRSLVGANRLFDLFARAGRPAGMSDAAVMCSWALTANGRTEEALEEAERALRLAKDSEHVGGEARAFVALALAYDGQGRADCALTQLHSALTAARNLGNARYVAAVLQFLGLAYLKVGQLELSGRALDESLDLARAHRDHHTQASTMLTMARLRLARNDPRARDAVEEALDIGREYGLPHHLADCLHVLGGIELAAGDRAAAIGCLAESVELWRSRGSLSFLARALADLGAAYGDDDPEKARAADDEARALFATLGPR